MPAIYFYTARNAEGLFVRGAVEAATQAAALANLRTRALFVTSLTSADSPAGFMLSRISIGGASYGARVAFFRSFATLIGAGVTMRRALGVTIEQSADARLREALCAIRADVEAGSPLSDAMAKRPKEFPKLFVAMVRAGEVGGVLDAVLNRLATFLERDRATRKRVASALTYPGIVAASAVVLVTFLLSSIVPMFAALYEQMHVPLPTSTELLLTIGLALHDTRLVLLSAGVLAAALLLTAQVLQTPQGRGLWDTLKLRAPILGPIMRKAIIARLARMLGSLLKSGVGLVLSLEVVSDVVGNRAYEDHMRVLRQALQEGDPLAESLSQSALYDPLVIQLVRVGEETGSLDAMLLRVAEYYELDVETALNTLGAALEPLLIVFLGGAVGFIVFSIFIPLYTLIGSIK